MDQYNGKLCKNKQGKRKQNVMWWCSIYSYVDDYLARCFSLPPLALLTSLYISTLPFRVATNAFYFLCVLCWEKLLALGTF